MTKPIIITLAPIQKTIASYKYLIENFELVNYNLSTEEQLTKDMQQEPYKSAVAIFGGFPSFHKVGGLHDREIIDSLPPNLKIIGLCSAGYDGYDLEYLQSKGISICNVPVDGHVGMDVADCALWHVLSGLRKFTSWNNRIQNSVQDQNTLENRDFVRNEFVSPEKREAGFAFGHMFHGQPIRKSGHRKCVVFGYGLIGKLVVERMLTIGMNVHVLVRDPSKYTNTDQNVTLFSSTSQQELHNATKDADVLVICLPGGAATKHIVNSHILHNINDHGIIVNVGRGSCIDMEALKVAIETGKVSHIGLDVFPNEPTIEKYWFDEKSINQKSNPFYTGSFTPHLGSATLDTLEYAEEECISNIINAIEKGEIKNAVN